MRLPLRKLLERAELREHRKIKPSGLGFSFSDRIAYVDPARWDAVTAGASLFLQRRFLAALDAARPENVEPRYVMVFDGGQPVAALVCQIVSVEAGRLAKNRKKARGRGQVLRRALRPVVDRVGHALSERIVVCGNLLSWGCHGIAVAPGADAARVWPAVSEALYRLRRAERLSGEADFTLVKDITKAEHGGYAHLAVSGFRRLPTEPNMVLTLAPGWRTYEDYLASLDGKYRKSARQIGKDIEAAGCVVEPLRVGVATARLHELYLSVQENNRLRLVTAPAAYLAALEAALGDDFRCTVVRQGEALLGFVVTLRDGERAIGYHIGFDRVLSQGLPVYLRLLHAVVSDALALGCRDISLGRTALEPKARLGARPEPFEVWVKHRAPGLSALLGGLLSAIPHAEAPERNPFKAKPR